MSNILFIFLGILFVCGELKSQEDHSGQQPSSQYTPTDKKNENNKTNDLSTKDKSEPESDTKQIERGTENEKSSAEKKEENPTHKLTGAITFVSDYRDRGISDSMRQPAVQGELKYTHKSGFYFKTWASNVDGTTHYYNNTSMEWDFYLGLEQQILKSDFTYEVGFLFYYYPGGQTAAPDFTNSHIFLSGSSSEFEVHFKKELYNTLEYYFGITYKGFNIKLSQSLTDFFAVNSHNPPTNWEKGLLGIPVKPNGHSFGSAYIEANYEWSPKQWPKFTTILHAGYQNVTNYSQLNYIDWQAGFTYKFDWLDFSASYIATNARKDFYNVPDNGFKPKKKNLGGPTVVIGINKSF